MICCKSVSMNEMVNARYEYAKPGTEEYALDKTEQDLCAPVRDSVLLHGSSV